MAEKQVYAAIAAVAGELATVGISKDRKNTQQGYQFRGIDDVYCALAPVLAKHKLVILPRVIDRNVTERQTKTGGTLFYVVVTMEFDLVSAEDGSLHTVKTVGEAMDSADKASNKAMSAAYKYAAFQTFCIPTEGEDADATTHEVKAGHNGNSAPATSRKETPVVEPPVSVEPPKHAEPTKGNGVLNQDQRRKFWEIARASGKSDNDIKAWLKKRGHESSSVIPASEFGSICAEVAKRA